MRRPPLPSLIAELIVERGPRDALVAGSVALFAAALDPKVWGPSLPSVQAAVRDHPQLETLVLFGAVVGSALLLVGGAIGDSTRARPVILGGLTIELLASVAGILVPDGPLFVVTRFIGSASAAFVIPVSIALVATSFEGVARATAIGLAYGAYGAAGAAAPILLQVSPGQRWPAFVTTIAVTGLAIWIARDRVTALAKPTIAERPYVVGTAIWAFGIIMLTVGLTWIGGGFENPSRWFLILSGFAVLLLALANDRRRRRHSAGPVEIERRPVAVAIVIGVVLGISVTAAMMELPLYFHLVLRYGPAVAMIAVGPLFVAFVVAGPIAGALIRRIPPRWLIGGGLVVLGLGNLVLGAVTTASAAYLAFVVPCLMIGGGFVVATTVRTAIIFASVPKGLPATAAALNEASMSVGSRIGIVLVTSIVTEVALAAYTTSVAGLPAADAAEAIAKFRDILVAIGTPSFSQVASAVGAADLRPYVDAYASGLQVVFLICGAVAIIGGLIASAAIGRRDPLTTVYDHHDERRPPATV